MGDILIVMIVHYIKCTKYMLITKVRLFIKVGKTLMSTKFRIRAKDSQIGKESIYLIRIKLYLCIFCDTFKE